MSLEHAPLEQATQKLLESYAVPLQHVQDLAAKTDRDFIDTEGVFQGSLKKQNSIELERAVQRVNGHVIGRAVTEIAQQAGLDDVSTIAFAFEAQRSLRMPDSNYRFVRPDVQNVFSRTVTKVQEAVAWWNNEAPLFLQYGSNENGITARALPSKGASNVVAEVNDGSGLHSGSPGKVYSTFENGVTVTVSGQDQLVDWVRISQDTSGFKWPIVGSLEWFAKPEDFMGKSYEKFAFVGQESQDIIERTNKERFAARIAVAKLVAVSEGVVPHVDLPAPSEDFNQMVVTMLANTTIRAFLAPQLISNVRKSHSKSFGESVKGVSTFEAKNLVKASTEQELRMFLGAANASVSDLCNVTQNALNAYHNRATLGSRIEAIQARTNIDTFFASF